MSNPHDDLAPPPYTENPSAGFSSPRSVGPLNPSLYTSHLAAHLATLPARIRETQQARSTQQAADDLDVVERILPHIEAFLADIASLPRPPRAAELTFVPAAAVPVPWALTGADERRREGDLVQLVRLELPDPGAAADGKGGGAGSASVADAKSGGHGSGPGRSSVLPERDWSSTQNLFDEWGRWEGDGSAGGGGSAAQRGSSWWWRDESAARRIASYLQPSPPVRTERRAIQAAVVQIKEEKKSSGWGWGWRRGESSTPTSPNPQAPSPSPSSPYSPPADAARSPVLEQGDRINMAVRADEITFRKENDFGVWESMSGWGIVVIVTIKRP